MEEIFGKGSRFWWFLPIAPVLEINYYEPVYRDKEFYRIQKENNTKPKISTNILIGIPIGILLTFVTIAYFL